MTCSACPGTVEPFLCADRAQRDRAAASGLSGRVAAYRHETVRPLLAARARPNPAIPDAAAARGGCGSTAVGAPTVDHSRLADDEIRHLLIPPRRPRQGQRRVRPPELQAYR